MSNKTFVEYEYLVWWVDQHSPEGQEDEGEPEEDPTRDLPIDDDDFPPGTN